MKQMLVALSLLATKDNYMRMERQQEVPTYWFGEKYIERWHDDELNVTCWVARGGGAFSISCLADSSIARARR